MLLFESLNFANQLSFLTHSKSCIHHLPTTLDTRSSLLECNRNGQSTCLIILKRHIITAAEAGT
ncbi:hypothetical protein BU183_14755 [Enterococcus faecium]|nr:hypothetical protein BU183_14755 [Enterococcus faecium]